MRCTLLGLTALATAASAQTVSNLIGLLYSTPELSNLSAYLGTHSQYGGMLSQLQNVTVLAPSNEAFAKLIATNTSAAAAIQADDASVIEAMLSYHVLQGVYYPSDFTEDTIEFISTTLDDPAYTNVTSGQVVEARAYADSVIFFSGLFSNSTIINATGGINFTGGVIHVVDTVLTFPPNISTVAIAANLTSAYGGLNQTDLLDTVDTMSDVTAFIPNNEAFRRIGPAISYISVEDLASIVQYHVVNASGFGIDPATNASTGPIGYTPDLINQTLVTVGGDNVTITVFDEDNIFVNNARIITPNIPVANGVVHVIDNVLNPLNTTALPVLSATAGAAPVFNSTAASTDTMVPLTSGVPTPTSTVPVFVTNTNTVTVTTTPSPTGSSSGKNAAAPRQTGVMGAAALFGGAAALMNL